MLHENTLCYTSAQVSTIYHIVLTYLKIHTGAITEYTLINETRKNITQVLTPF
jgi:hypothetical protein